MKDRSIDTPEMQQYGAHFIASAPAWLSIHPAMMQELIDEEAALQARIDALLKSTGDTRSVSRTSAKGQRELVNEAVALLKKLYEKLWPDRNDGTFDLKRFFSTGLKGEIKATIADSKRLVKQVNEAFQQYPGIKGVEDLQKQLAELEPKLSGKIDTASSSNSVKLTTTKEWRALRIEWEQAWLGKQLIVRGLFTRRGQKQEWKKLFLDLQAAGPKPKSQADGQSGKEAEAKAGEGGSAPAGEGSSAEAATGTADAQTGGEAKG